MNTLGINWKLKLEERIRFLEDKNRKLIIRNKFLERRMMDNENNNIRTTGNRENNNIIEFSR
jgi:hypothetical protein